MSTFDALWQKLRNKQYREHFVASQLKRSIPYQVRALMKTQGLSQTELAQRASLNQGVVSRAADPNYGNLTLTTVAKLAAGFDLAVVCHFVPFSKMGRWVDTLSEDDFALPTFNEEDAVNTQTADATTATASTVNFLGSTGRSAVLNTIGSPQPTWAMVPIRAQGTHTDVRYAERS